MSFLSYFAVNLSNFLFDKSKKTYIKFLNEITFWSITMTNTKEYICDIINILKTKIKDDIIKPLKLKDKNTIEVLNDKTSKITKVNLNGKEIYSKNWGDFHPGYHDTSLGYLLNSQYNWEGGRMAYAMALQNLIKGQGKKARILMETYNAE